MWRQPYLGEMVLRDVPKEEIRSPAVELRIHLVVHLIALFMEDGLSACTHPATRGHSSDTRQTFVRIDHT